MNNNIYLTEETQVGAYGKYNDICYKLIGKVEGQPSGSLIESDDCCGTTTSTTSTTTTSTTSTNTPDGGYEYVQCVDTVTLIYIATIQSALVDYQGLCYEATGAYIQSVPIVNVTSLTGSSCIDCDGYTTTTTTTTTTSTTTPPDQYWPRYDECPGGASGTIVYDNNGSGLQPQ